MQGLNPLYWRSRSLCCYTLVIFKVKVFGQPFVFLSYLCYYFKYSNVTSYKHCPACKQCMCRRCVHYTEGQGRILGYRFCLKFLVKVFWQPLFSFYMVVTIVYTCSKFTYTLSPVQLKDMEGLSPLYCRSRSLFCYTWVIFKVTVFWQPFFSVISLLLLHIFQCKFT